MSKKQKVLIMVSKFGHCLNHILYQWKTGSLNCEIPLIVSNHSDMKEIAKPYRIKYNVLNINKTNKQQQEKRLYNLIKDNKIDLVVLARYMQVLSPEICKILEGKIINIHHSFLPSFKGARPYNQAFLQGVKIIGATAHYVNEKLDEGQIIEQDVARVDHTKTLENFISIGRDIENLVLKNAINWHLERRVIINENRTIVFN
jgi:formyltetrahydrofolate deformylase